MHTHVHTCAAHPCLRACRRTGPWHALAHGPPAGHPALPRSHGVGRGCSGGTPVPPRGQQGQGRAGAGDPLAVTCTCSVPSLRWPRWAGSARDAVLLLEAMRARGRRRLARFRHLSPLGTVPRARGHPACPAVPTGPCSRAPGEGLCPSLPISPRTPASPCQPQHPSLAAASPRCAGEREGAAPAAAEQPGQMRRAHFATASPAEAAEPQACTYPAATWHGKKGHSSRRNSLHAWRHPLLTAREATVRVFPAPPAPPQPGLAPRSRAGMLPVPPHPQRSLPAPTGCQGRSRPGPDSADSAFWG